MNLLLIDNEIPGLDLFIKSCNSNTKCVVYDTKHVTLPMLDKYITSLNITKYNYLGFVFVNDNNIHKLFVDNKPFISYNDWGIMDNYTTNFIKYLIKKYTIKTVDFLACNLLNEPIWKQYFDFIQSLNHIIVRASNDRTGNLLSGGDWILESTGENVENLYFNTSIKYWNFLLDSAGSTMSQSTLVISTDSSNNLYVCGDNRFGQLGLGNTINQSTFQNPTSNISGKKIIYAVSGQGLQSFILTNDSSNNLYVCGSNTSGQLGLDTTTPYTTFQNATINISGKKIISASTGSMSFILTNDTSNNLYGCGSNIRGTLGLGNNTSYTTFQNPTINISGKKIINVSCGSVSCLILTDEIQNNLYGCGDNLYGQLGLGPTTATTYNTFQNVVTNISGKKVLFASAGDVHTLILTNDVINNLYSCGDNSDGQLGLGTTTTKYDTFQPVTTNISGKKITLVSAGQFHSLIMTNDSSNNVWSCGFNLYGQLGLGGTSIASRNTFQNSLNTISNRTANDLTASTNSSFIITSDLMNNFYSCGQNNVGQLDLSNNVNQPFFVNTKINIYNKKILLNSLINMNTPNTSLFTNFNYGTDNITYYSSAQDSLTNTLTISNIANPELIFPNLASVIDKVYTFGPNGVTFGSIISFTINKVWYLSNVYYQYNSESSLISMSKQSSQIPYYTYDGENVTIYTISLFTYLVLTVPPSNTGSQFSNLNQLIINATDNPLLLPNTYLNYTFYNTQDISANINNWDISGITTMEGMFRRSSFNNPIINWKPSRTTNMNYMFYEANNFNQKLSYNPTNQSWDVSSVTTMVSIFNNAYSFNNSQALGGVTEPLNWALNSNVNITNDVSNSSLTVANAQSLVPNLLVYLNIGILNQNSTGGSTQYPINFYNEDNTIGSTNTRLQNSNYSNFISRYNIAGDSLWNFRIDCSNGLGPTDGCISSDLSRNIIITGRWNKNFTLLPSDPNSCRFYNVDSTLAKTLAFSGNALQTNFLTKYDASGYFSWGTRMIGSTVISGTDPSYGNLFSNVNSDTTGNIYVIGRNKRLTTFENSDESIWTTFGDSNALFDKAWILKYNKNGFGQWLAPITTNLSGSSGYPTNGLAINIDICNNIYGVGSYDVSTNIYDATNVVRKNVYTKGNWLSKYNSSGAVIWATNFIGTINNGTNMNSRSIGYSFDNDLYICGKYDTSGVSFINKTDVSFVKLTDISNSNGFLVKYTSDEGTAAWASRIGVSQNGENVCVCSNKQFQDIPLLLQGLRFGIYNGYFDTYAIGNKYGFFYSNYPYYSNTVTDLTNIDTSTLNQFLIGIGTNTTRSVCWYGYFRAKKTGAYTFKTRSNQASYIYINGNRIVNNNGAPIRDVIGTCNLISGMYYYLQMFYGYNSTGTPEFSASYSEPDANGIQNTTNYITNATDLNTYYLNNPNDINNTNMMFYDNWINQPLGTTVSYTTSDLTLNSIKENFLNISMTNSTDPQITLLNRPSINPNIYKYIHIKYKLISGTANTLSIYYGNNDFDFNDTRKADYIYPINSDIIGTWQIAVVDMSAYSNWNITNWTKYRIDPISSGTANILFEYFILSSNNSYSLDEFGNDIYVCGYSASNTLTIYNSSFYYNTTSDGNSSQTNNLFKQYTSNNISDKTYIIKYNLLGQCMWSIYYDQNFSRPQSIKTDKTGNVYVFGQFNDTTLNIKDKYGITRKILDSTGNYQTFIAVYSSSGNYLWATKQTSSQRNQVIASNTELNPLLLGQSMSIS